MKAIKNNQNNRSSARITRQNLSSMKAKARVNRNLIAWLKQLADATVSETIGFVNELSRVLLTKSDACSYNSHVLSQRPGAIWSVQPTCSKCGCDITSLHQVSMGLAGNNDSDNSIESRLTTSLKQRRIDLIAIR